MACDNHDLEAVYGSYNYSYDLIDILYTMDQETFDIVVVGGTNRSVGIFVYLEEASCSVKWHYIFENNEKFPAIQIRSQTNSVYGIMDSEYVYYFFEAKTDIGSQNDLVFELFPLADFDDRSDIMYIVAPLNTKTVYYLQEEDFMSLTPYKSGSGY